MKSTNPHCLLRAASSFPERPSSSCRQIDSQITQAFHQLRLHAEELALELAARLRVLGKSLAMLCHEGGGFTGDKAAAYQTLRLQLDKFISSIGNHDFAGHRHFPVVLDYFREFLPVELDRCSGQACSVEHVETIISLLSESLSEDYWTNPALSVSL